MLPQERQHEGLGERQHEGLGERRHEEVFGLGDSFAVGLGAVAGACVGRWTGQPRMPPRERQHEGLGERQHEGLGERRHEGVFGLGDSFAVGLGAVAGACVGRGERPATHAAAGAAARGVLVFSLVCLVPVVRAYVAGACVGRGSGQPRMPPRERQHEGLGERQHEGLGGGTRGFLVWGILSHPRERPATHAAAGAASTRN